ncbi:MAG: hypothetical protein RLY70_1559, partial [Planctomycetota bacterium]
MSLCTTDILSVASMSYSAPVPFGRVAALPNGRSQRGFAARSVLAPAATDKMSVVQRGVFPDPTAESRPSLGVTDKTSVVRKSRTTGWRMNWQARRTNLFPLGFQFLRPKALAGGDHAVAVQVELREL